MLFPSQMQNVFSLLNSDFFGLGDRVLNTLCDPALTSTRNLLAYKFNWHTENTWRGKVEIQ